MRPDGYDEKIVKKKWTEEAERVLTAYKEALKHVDRVNKDNAKNILQDVLEQEDVKMGKVMQALRLSLTGAGAGPDLMDIIEILGKNEVVERIEIALDSLSNKVKT